jgi:hypothetical protein
MPSNRLKLIALTLSAIGLISGCGGGDDPVAAAPPPPSPASTNVASSDVPIAATQQVADLLVFTKQQQSARSETSEPLVLGDATQLASDDSAEPGEVF